MIINNTKLHKNNSTQYLSACAIEPNLLLQLKIYILKFQAPKNNVICLKKLLISENSISTAMQNPEDIFVQVYKTASYKFTWKTNIKKQKALLKKQNLRIFAKDNHQILNIQ